MSFAGSRPETSHRPMHAIPYKIPLGTLHLAAVWLKASPIRPAEPVNSRGVSVPSASSRNLSTNGRFGANSLARPKGCNSPRAEISPAADSCPWSFPAEAGHVGDDCSPPLAGAGITARTSYRASARMTSACIPLLSSETSSPFIRSKSGWTIPAGSRYTV